MKFWKVICLRLTFIEESKSTLAESLLAETKLVILKITWNQEFTVHCGLLTPDTLGWGFDYHLGTGITSGSLENLPN